MKQADETSKGLRHDVTRVGPESKLTREDLLRIPDGFIPDGERKTGIMDLSELEKGLKSDQEKINLLGKYIADLLGVIRRLEDQLQQTSDTGMVGRTMLAGLAHDLRNPMSVISSCAQFCLENEELTSVTREYLEMIRQNSKAVNKMLNNFLEFAKTNLNFKSVNLNQIIQKTWRSAVLDAGAEKVTFTAHLSDDLPEIFGDPEKIERVFLNIFLNAIQAVSQHGPKGIVTVHTRFLGAQNLTEVNVTDNGPGIPEDIREKIFEPFFTTKKEGTGLGLHLCQHFIEQHKGKITIGTAHKGGTKVTVTLPLRQEKETTPY